VLYSLVVVGALVCALVGATGWLTARGVRSRAQGARRMAMTSTALCVAAVLVYQKPGSFYTNFVIFPSMLLWLSGILASVVAVVVSGLAVIRGESKARALASFVLAAVAPVLAFVVILWRSSGP
jgi:hypothetical protein